MSIIKDEFIPGQSVRKNINGIAQTIRLDLSLNPNPHINSGTVTGTVRDVNGNPISDAVVIILDGTYTSVANTNTGNDGTYSFSISIRIGLPGLCPVTGFCCRCHAI